jgi:hypothetical protein
LLNPLDLIDPASDTVADDAHRLASPDGRRALFARELSELSF